MTTRILVPIFIILILASCKNTPTQNPQQETPEVLQDKNSSYEIISKRSYDLVESLYNEILKKDKGLGKLENDITSLNESRNDTTKSFDNFNNKNESYYNTVSRYIEQMGDSILKAKMMTIVTNSRTNYNLLLAKHNNLLKTIESNDVALNDLHIVLKITKTISLIEKYQKDNLPATQPLEGYIHRQNEVIKFADTLVKK